MLALFLDNPKDSSINKSQHPDNMAFIVFCFVLLSFLWFAFNPVCICMHLFMCLRIILLDSSLRQAGGSLWDCQPSLEWVSSIVRPCLTQTNCTNPISHTPRTPKTDSLSYRPRQDPLALASKVAETTGGPHQTWLLCALIVRFCSEAWVYLRDSSDYCEWSQVCCIILVCACLAVMW